MSTKKLLSGFILMTLLGVFNRSEAQLGVRAGLNLYSVITKDRNGNEVYNDPKLNPGFHVGVTYDVPIAENFYVQSAALLSTKGYRIKRVEEYSSVESYITPYYVEVPVNLLFAPKLGKGRLLLGAGPYIAYGVSGKGKYYGKNVVDEVLVTDNQSANLDFVEDFGDVKEGKWAYAKPLDYGIQIVEGYEFKGHLSVQVIGQLGLANIQPNTSGIAPVNKLKNFGLGVSVGYIF